MDLEMYCLILFNKYDEVVNDIDGFHLLETANLIGEILQESDLFPDVDWYIIEPYMESDFEVASNKGWFDNFFDEYFDDDDGDIIVGVGRK